MTLYVLFLAASMGAGGLMPWILQRCLGHLPVFVQHSRGSSSSGPALQRVYREEPGYSYINSNKYSYCRKPVALGGETQQRHCWVRLAC